MTAAAHWNWRCPFQQLEWMAAGKSGAVSRVLGLGDAGFSRCPLDMSTNGLSLGLGIFHLGPGTRFRVMPKSCSVGKVGRALCSRDLLLPLIWPHLEFDLYTRPAYLSERGGWRVRVGASFATDGCYMRRISM